MKKSLCFVLSVVVMLLCSSCGLFGDREYACDVDKVISVQIIKLDKYVQEEYRYEYTVLSEIEDFGSFVSALNDLEYSVNWGDPRQMEEGYVVIRIDYLNGDFDLIHKDAQCFHQGGTNNYGYFFFDSEQFDALISDYESE